MKKTIFFLNLFTLIYVFSCILTKKIFAFVPPEMFKGPSYQIDVLYNKKHITEPYCVFFISASNNKLSQDRKIEICNNYILQKNQKQFQYEIMITKDGNNVVINDCTNNNFCTFGNSRPFDTPKFDLSIYIPSSKKFLSTSIKTQISEKDFGYVTQKYKIQINSDDSININRRIVKMEELNKLKTNKSRFKWIIFGISVVTILIFKIFKNRNKKT